jgi:hypothetical protein
MSIEKPYVIAVLATMLWVCAFQAGWNLADAVGRQLRTRLRGSGPGYETPFYAVLGFPVVIALPAALSVHDDLLRDADRLERLGLFALCVGAAIFIAMYCGRLACWGRLIRRAALNKEKKVRNSTKKTT